MAGQLNLNSMSKSEETIISVLHEDKAKLINRLSVMKGKFNALNTALNDRNNIIDVLMVEICELKNDKQNLKRKNNDLLDDLKRKNNDLLIALRRKREHVEMLKYKIISLKEELDLVRKLYEASRHLLRIRKERAKKAEKSGT